MKTLQTLALVSTLILSGTATSSTMTQDQVGEMAVAYLKDHPQEVINILKSVQTYAQQHQLNQAKHNIVNAKSFFLGKDSFLPTIGNHDASKTLVFIYDFQCIYCHKEWPLIAKLLKQNKDLKVVLMPLHFFGSASKFANKVALYANTIGKFEEFYNAMEATGLIEGKLKKSDVVKVMHKVGISQKEFKDVLKHGMLNKQVKQIDMMARKLMVSGTPYMAVMPSNISKVSIKTVTVLPGYVSADVLKKSIQM